MKNERKLSDLVADWVADIENRPVEGDRNLCNTDTEVAKDTAYYRMAVNVERWLGCRDDASCAVAFDGLDIIDPGAPLGFLVSYCDAGQQAVVYGCTAARLNFCSLERQWIWKLSDVSAVEDASSTPRLYFGHSLRNSQSRIRERLARQIAEQLTGTKPRHLLSDCGRRMVQNGCYKYSLKTDGELFVGFRNPDANWARIEDLQGRFIDNVYSDPQELDEDEAGNPVTKGHFDINSFQREGFVLSRRC